MSAVRGYAEMAEVLRYDDGASTPTFGDLEEAAALLAAVAATLPTCPTCGGTGNVWGPGGVVYATTVEACPDCVDGKVTVAQLAALWDAVHEANISPIIADDREAGYVAAIRELRSVRS